MKMRVDSRLGDVVTTVKEYGTTAGSFWWVAQDKPYRTIRLFISPNSEECEPRINNGEDSSVIVDRIDRHFAACRLEYITDPAEQHEWTRNLLVLPIYPMYTTRIKTGKQALMYGVHRGWEVTAPFEIGCNDYVLVDHSDIFEVMREISAHICTEIADGKIYFD